MADVVIRDTRELEAFQRDITQAIRDLDSTLNRFRGRNSGLKKAWPDSTGRRFTADVDKAIANLQRERKQLDSLLPVLRNKIEAAKRFQSA